MDEEVLCKRKLLFQNVFAVMPYRKTFLHSNGTKFYQEPHGVNILQI